MCHNQCQGMADMQMCLPRVSRDSASLAKRAYRRGKIDEGRHAIGGHYGLWQGSLLKGVVVDAES
eukprot:scaffold86660_cov32-Prasinocladus_malaysianus.AAC.1